MPEREITGTDEQLAIPIVNESILSRRKCPRGTQEDLCSLRNSSPVFLRQTEKFGWQAQKL